MSAPKRWPISRLFAKRPRPPMPASPNGGFWRDVFGLIVDYKWYALAVLAVTAVQEVIALWPVNLLGEFIDRFSSGDLGNVVLWFMGASLLAPLVMRGNVILRHKMFYETDFAKRVQMTLELCDEEREIDPEEAGQANARIANAVSGITNATYHVLGSFLPVIIKIIVVSSSLLAMNVQLGLAYLASLIIPGAMTVVFNKRLRVLRDDQYGLINQVEGAAIRTITDPKVPAHRERLRDVLRRRKDVYVELLSRHQWYLYLRYGALIGAQFLVVFLALAQRTQIGLTAGDMSRIIGYTTQVAGAFLEAAACLDAIISFSRAYHVYATGR